MQNEETIQDEIDNAIEQNGKYPGMTYEEGVQHALEWVLGQRDSSPLSDD